MRAGRLDRRVTFRRKIVTENDFGEEIEAFGDVATRWAMRLPNDAARETTDAGEIRAASLTTRIRIRQGGFEPTAQDRFVLEGQEYDVLGVTTSVHRGRFYEITGKGRADG